MENEILRDAGWKVGRKVDGKLGNSRVRKNVLRGNVEVSKIGRLN